VNIFLADRISEYKEVFHLYKLLLLEDDFSLVDGLMYSLKKNGFDLEVAGTIREAEKLVAGHTGFDLFLFDVTLPDGSGFVLCEKLRKAGNRTPIIFLTASDEETSIIRGLDGGGDDYITKPFKLGELCSRIRALLRRSNLGDSGGREEVFCSGELLVNLVEGRAFLNGEPLELTGAEYRLLCLLLNNSGRVLTRSMILDRLWDGSGSFVDDNTLSVYIHRLREKLEKNPSCPEHLKTVRGIGYQWRE
jgi:two-component system response regulator RegX3